MSAVNKLTTTGAIELGIKEGLMAFFARADEILVDLDKPNAEVDKRAFSALKSNHIASGAILYTVSKSGNTHAYLRTDALLTPMARLVYQAALGSDPVKEILSSEMHRLDSEVVTFLFETPEEAKRVVEWRKKCY